MSVRKICVLLAEDHQTVRQGLKLMVNSEPDMEVVGEAGDRVLTSYVPQTGLR